jgi:hypothetical protein
MGCTGTSQEEVSQSSEHTCDALPLSDSRGEKNINRLDNNVDEGNDFDAKKRRRI